jgi:uncharacterized protein (UPF0548 family)
MRVLHLGKPSPEVVHRELEEQRSQAFSYAAIGATNGELPAGYHHDRLETDLGPDEGGRFEGAVDAVLHWVPQKSAGIAMFPDEPVAPDLAFVLLLKLPLVGWATAPARVAYVVDEPNKAGFAYGTLPGHPETGEEAFLVLRREGRVVFQVIAFSQPRLLLARLGQPVARAVQVHTLRIYLRAMEAATR